MKKHFLYWLIAVVVLFVYPLTVAALVAKAG
jgi:hypothetical protein